MCDLWIQINMILLFRFCSSASLFCLLLLYSFRFFFLFCYSILVLKLFTKMELMGVCVCECVIRSYKLKCSNWLFILEVKSVWCEFNGYKCKATKYIRFSEKWLLVLFCKIYAISGEWISTKIIEIWTLNLYYYFNRFVYNDSFICGQLLKSYPPVQFSCLEIRVYWN